MSNNTPIHTFDDLDTMTAETEKALEDFKETVTEMSAKIEQHTPFAMPLSTRIDTMRARIATLEAEALTAAEKLANAERKLEAAAARIQHLETTLRNCKAAIGMCREELKKLPRVTPSDDEGCHQT